MVYLPHSLKKGVVSRCLSAFASRNLIHARNMSASPLAALVDKAAARLPHKESIRDIGYDARYPFKDIKMYAEGLANGLLDFGLNPGDTIAILVHPGSDNTITQFAAAKAGMKIALLDLASTKDSILQTLQHSEARIFLFDELTPAGNVTEMVRELVPALQYCTDTGRPLRDPKVPRLRYVVSTGQEEFDILKLYDCLLMNEDIRYYDRANVDPETPFATLYKDGKPGNSFTHQQILEKAKSLKESATLNADDRILSLSQENSVDFLAFACLASNATLIFPDTKFDEEDVAKIIDAELCTATADVGIKRLQA